MFGDASVYPSSVSSAAQGAGSALPYSHYSQSRIWKSCSDAEVGNLARPKGQASTCFMPK